MESKDPNLVEYLLTENTDINFEDIVFDFDSKPNESKMILKLMFSKWGNSKYRMYPNIKKGLGWEADLLILNRDRTLEEVEIKISIQDFNLDNKKDKHKLFKSGKGSKISKFWYAVPEKIATPVARLLPDYAGLLVVGKSIKVAKKPKLLKSVPVTQEVENQFNTSLYYRFWSNWIRIFYLKNKPKDKQNK